MTIDPAATLTRASARLGRQGAYARWGRRALGFLVDGLVLPALVAAPLVALAALLLPVSRALALVVAAAGLVGAALFAVAQLVRQGTLGATLGKQLLGLRLADAASGRPVGVARSLARPLAHLLDALPLGAGFLLPLVDRRRQTLADKALRSVVLQVPGTPIGTALPALAVASTALLLAGALTVFLQRSDDTPPSGSAAPPPASTTPPPPSPTTSASPSPTTPTTPSPTPSPTPTSLLPAGDLEGRLAPVADGFRPVPDGPAGLGRLDARGTARVLGAQGAAVDADAEDLRRSGFVEAFARGYERSGRLSSVIVYRFETPAAASAFAAELAREEQTRPTPVPGAVVYTAQGEAKAPTGLFARGAYVYEVAVLRRSGPTPDTDLTPLLQRQLDHAGRVDP